MSLLLEYEPIVNANELGGIRTVADMNKPEFWNDAENLIIPQGKYIKTEVVKENVGTGEMKGNITLCGTIGDGVINSQIVTEIKFDEENEVKYIYDSCKYNSNYLNTTDESLGERSVLGLMTSFSAEGKNGEEIQTMNDYFVVGSVLPIKEPGVLVSESNNGDTVESWLCGRNLSLERYYGTGKVTDKYMFIDSTTLHLLNSKTHNYFAIELNDENNTEEYTYLIDRTTTNINQNFLSGSNSLPSWITFETKDNENVMNVDGNIIAQVVGGSVGGEFLSLKGSNCSLSNIMTGVNNYIPILVNDKLNTTLIPQALSIDTLTCSGAEINNLTVNDDLIGGENCSTTFNSNVTVNGGITSTTLTSNNAVLRDGLKVLVNGDEIEGLVNLDIYGLSVENTETGDIKHSKLTPNGLTIEDRQIWNQDKLQISKEAVELPTTLALTSANITNLTIGSDLLLDNGKAITCTSGGNEVIVAPNRIQFKKGSNMFQIHVDDLPTGDGIKLLTSGKITQTLLS